MMPKKFFKLSTKLSNNVIIYDLETGGNDPMTTEPLEIAAIAVDMQTLTPKENGTFGPVIIKPTDWDLVSDKALAKNGLKREELAQGADQQVVMKQFFDFCRLFNTGTKIWDLPIPGGYNIKGFDNIIMNRMCKKYEHTNSDGEYLLFNPLHNFDLADMCRFWFHDTSEGPEGYSLEKIRDFFGVSKEGAHRAMKDVDDTLLILRRLLQFQRKLNVKYVDKFKGAFR